MRNILFASLLCFSFLIVSCEKAQEVVEDATKDAATDSAKDAGMDSAKDAATDSAKDPAGKMVK